MDGHYVHCTCTDAYLLSGMLLWLRLYPRWNTMHLTIKKINADVYCSESLETAYLMFVNPHGCRRWGCLAESAAKRAALHGHREPLVRPGKSEVAGSLR